MVARGRWGRKPALSQKSPLVGRAGAGALAVVEGWTPDGGWVQSPRRLSPGGAAGLLQSSGCRGLQTGRTALSQGRGQQGHSRAGALGCWAMVTLCHRLCHGMGEKLL